MFVLYGTTCVQMFVQNISFYDIYSIKSTKYFIFNLFNARLMFQSRM